MVAINRIVEVFMLKNGITLDSIRQMTGEEVAEYVAVLQEMQQAESDKLQASLGR